MLSEDEQIELIEDGYILCDDDPRFGYCTLCDSEKLFLGNNPIDRERHEERCEYR